MKLIEFIKKEQLDAFIATEENSGFLQSWQWGELQNGAGFDIRRIGVEENGEVLVAATLIKKKLIGKWSYLYCPRGPVINSRIKNNELRIKVIDFLFKEIRVIAEKESVLFLRFEPISNFQFLPPQRDPAKAVATFSFQQTFDAQPSKTIILDLSKSEEELLNAMHQKTRYNIRLAEKKNLQIVEAEDENFAEYWKIMESTGERDAFRLHSQKYYANMLEHGKGFLKLILVKFENEILAGNIVSFFGDTVTYVHGASANEKRNLMAPYLLQWHCMKEAKNLGYKYYDFFGIDEKKWPGVTRFKRGFGGQEVIYPGTFDLIFNKTWYSIYKLFRKARRLL